MSDVVKVLLVLNKGLTEDSYDDVWEVDRQWWEGLSEFQKEKELSLMAMEFAISFVDVSATVIEEG